MILHETSVGGENLAIHFGCYSKASPLQSCIRSIVPIGAKETFNTPGVD